MRNEKQITKHFCTGFIQIGFTVTQKKFVLANKIKKNCHNFAIIVWYYDSWSFLMFLVSAVPWLVDSFATDRFI